MFHCSKQRKMLYGSEREIQDRRRSVNQKFKDENPACSDYFMTVEEERLLCQKFERELVRFCKVFESPPLFRSVHCTAMDYFKRFYLRRSAMQFYPQNVMLLCVYFACKVEEFNIGISQFVAMLEESLQSAASAFILGNEFLLMEALGYSLTVYNSLRPLDGFLIELTDRLGEDTARRLKKNALSFLGDAILTDITLLHPPSQIALASLVYSAETNKISISYYLSELSPDPSTHQKLLKSISTIRQHLQLNYKFQITSSKLKELEGKCSAISKCLSGDTEYESSGDEENSGPGRVTKRRKTVEMETS